MEYQPVDNKGYRKAGLHCGVFDRDAGARGGRGDGGSHGNSRTVRRRWGRRLGVTASRCAWLHWNTDLNDSAGFGLAIDGEHALRVATICAQRLGQVVSARELVARLDHPALELGEQRRAPLLVHGGALGRQQAVSNRHRCASRLQPLADRPVWASRRAPSCAPPLRHRPAQTLCAGCGPSSWLPEQTPADDPSHRGRHNHQRHRPAECRSSRRDAPRMFPSTIAGTGEHCRGRTGAAERSVIVSIRR